MAQYSHEDVLDLWIRGLTKEKPEYRGTNVFVVGADAFSYGRHYLMGRRLTSQAVLTNTYTYSVSTAKQLSIMRRVIRNNCSNNYVLPFSNSGGRNSWWDSPSGLPSVGNILEYNGSTFLKDSGVALDLYDKYLDANTGGLKYGLWVGDYDKLIKVLREPDDNGAVNNIGSLSTRIFMEAEGLEEALALIAKRGIGIDHQIASTMIGAGATVIPGVEGLKGWYWSTWRAIQRAGGVEEQYKAATDVFLTRQREEDRRAASDFINNLNRRSA